MKRIPYLLLVLMLVSSCGASRQAGRTDDVRQASDLETNSIGRVDMKNAETYTNIYDYLRGRVPGVEIVGTSIRIRGINTTGNTDALIILDGMEVSDISDVNPMDVKSVEVLKDAASTMYGMRGANGVVIIKTKGAGDD
ncbi:TonB-dependent outer membrane receptor, SusC/RagA subfamily, signature region [Bacteroidales bacterium WCE2004]|nr:TonB-dependent receptor plug domain-containing protein [Bacteroidales bacterium]SKC47001.1 TonB-dependent outer membrane receptor, SusC/RagA subfamily, signature region [Bacteroidales bacterium WCE2004]